MQVLRMYWLLETGNFTQKSVEGFLESLSAEMLAVRSGEIHIPIVQIFVTNEPRNNEEIQKE
jgi:hypothetical protein